MSTIDTTKPNWRLDAEIYHRLFCKPEPLRSVGALPSYSGNMGAAHAMEAEIERQGLAREYVRALSVIAGIANYASMYQRYWLLTHATACQRCAAALQAIDAPATERRVQYRESPSPPYVQAEIDRGPKLGRKAAEISERKKGGCEPRQ